MSSSPDSWNEKYRRGEEAGAEPDPMVVEAADLVGAGFALDVACGRGRNSLYLAGRGFQVTAIDFSDVALESFDHPCIRKLLVDLETIDRLGSFDLIVNIRYLQRTLFPKLRAALNPGGVIAASIAMVDHDPAIKPMNPAYLLVPGELKQAFGDLVILRDDEYKEPGRRRIQRFLARNGSAQSALS